MVDHTPRIHIIGVVVIIIFILMVIFTLIWNIPDVCKPSQSSKKNVSWSVPLVTLVVFGSFGN